MTTSLPTFRKTGTYSVIPRSAGGEITPEGLLAIGQIAREYNLYTKITGSQAYRYVWRTKRRFARYLEQTD
ncbi:nitrite reductase subunit NirD [Hafnia alvei]|uniref:Nitrite reductase subunit NirD n=1 Tax=Hafnia alvei TaxID=569 RepID=A0A377PT49_HAFAL|nr:nitrite reductase subunit NirD [Hafnia alvei]